ncbi:MAG: hypothetical protein ACOZBH_04390 [Patescibacteria group bacterium]
MEKKSNRALIIFFLIIIALLLAAGVYFGWKFLQKLNRVESIQNENQNIILDPLTSTATTEPEINTQTVEPTIQEIATQYLPDGYEFEHQVLKGSFGPWSEAILFFYKEKDCFHCRWAGKALIKEKTGYKQLSLPDLNQFDNQTVDNIKIASVMFTNLDADQDNEIIILNEGYKKGPNGWSIYNTAVLDWRSSAFEDLYAWQNYFNENCENAECLKKYIGAYQNFVGSYESPNEAIAADLVVKPDSDGILSATWNALYLTDHICEASFIVTVVEANWIRLYSGEGEKTGNIIKRENGSYEINFYSDLSELDCGAGHPLAVDMEKKQ